MTTANDTTSKNLLALKEVAILLDGGDQIPLETARRLGSVIRTDPRFAEQIEQLEALAQDAASEQGSGHCYADGVDANDDLARLLAAEHWADPAEILDPSGERGIPFAPLIQITRARIERASEPGELLSVLAKLQQAALFDELRQNIAQLNTRLEGLGVPAPPKLDSTLGDLETLLRKLRQAAADAPKCRSQRHATATSAA